jgi:hypothetical protein
MLDQYRELIDELLGTPGAIRRLIEERGEAPPAALALLAVLRARDAAVLDRLQTMTRQRDPVLRPLPAPDASPAAGPDLLDRFDTARGDLVSLLMNLTLRDWERTAIDENDGQVSLADEVERHVEFDEDHLARIRAAFAAG